jgi:RNA polymerase sigma-70 factor, ECF subfamily
LHTEDEAQQTLLARYVDAFQRSDIESLVSVLHEDATVAMPS